MSVDRSLRFVSVQLVNDDAGVTLASATDKGMKEHMTRVERAVRVGQDIAKRAQDAGITTVVFDRGSAKYHGRVKALADAAREGGLKF
ncbi:MAG: Ribosomal protein L18 [Parcubacteria group bacterium GW2011_GWA2_56_7]|nr:MAG: Ribosomal protein L18 [Parcubacteria group bacterium GW2011_GWA2_56_7]